MSRRPGPEAVVEKHLRKQVEAAGGVAWKFLSSRAGVPDRVVVLNGHTVFVELKRPGVRTPRKLQLHQHRLIRCAGGRVEVINNIADVDLFLAGLRHATPKS